MSRAPSGTGFLTSALSPGGRCLADSALPFAFTLIEVMLAIAILALICGSIYQFTNTVLRSSSIATRLDAQTRSFDGLRQLLDAQFAALPTNDTGTFIGINVDGKNGAHLDAMQIVCPAGNGVLTPDAHGLYRLTVGLDEIPPGGGHYALVMEREPWTEGEDSAGSGVIVTSGPVQTVKSNATGITRLPSDSVRLLEGVSSLEITYYDPRLNAWQDRWNDDTMIPSLVRVKLAVEGAGAPYEFIEQVPSGGIRRGLPNTLTSLNGVPNIPGVFSPSGSTVPTLPPGLSIPSPPPGGFTVPSLPPNFQGGVPPGVPNVPAPR